MIDHYQTLGLPRNATTSQIKATFKLLAKKYHPDVSGDTVKMATINDAYRVLVDPKQRFVYDKSLELEDFDELSSRSREAPRRAPTNSVRKQQSQKMTPPTFFTSPDFQSKFGVFALFGFSVLALGIFGFVLFGIFDATKTSAINSVTSAPASSDFPGVASSASQTTAVAAQPTHSCTTNPTQNIAQQQSLKLDISALEKQIAALHYDPNAIAKHDYKPSLIAHYNALVEQLIAKQSALAALQPSNKSC